MQFLKIVFFGLLAIASAGPVANMKRTPTTIISEITIVKNQLQAVDTDVNNYNGGLLGPLVILALISDVNDLEDDANTLNNDVIATGTLGEDDSETIAAEIADLVTILCITLADTVSKVCEVVFGVGQERKDSRLTKPRRKL
jgi:hypothetical protein